tara:strand:- start:93 stop:299 length:207 start_codon:yes stop_codon:yes gene_type:complete
MRIKIIYNCHECDGYGVVSRGHSNDPDSTNVKCQECDGSGKGFYIEDHYDSLSDAQDDYPEAVGFTYL